VSRPTSTRPSPSFRRQSHGTGLLGEVEAHPLVGCGCSPWSAAPSGGCEREVPRVRFPRAELRAPPGTYPCARAPPSHIDRPGLLDVLWTPPCLLGLVVSPGNLGGGDLVCGTSANGLTGFLDPSAWCQVMRFPWSERKLPGAYFGERRCALGSRPLFGVTFGRQAVRLVPMKRMVRRRPARCVDCGGAVLVPGICPDCRRIDGEQLELPLSA